ncbi:MAG TPA: hypothetical protein VGL42_06680 [Opitutaceae bacterium]
MTKKAEAIIRRFESDRNSLREKVAARLAGLSSDERLKILVDAGVLTKKGKLAATYRPKRAAA